VNGQHPILMGHGVEIDPLLPQVRRMIEAEGIYIATDAGQPGAQIPLVVQGGRVFAMKLDGELDPAALFESVRIAGPFFGPEEETPAVAAPEHDPAETWWHGVEVRCQGCRASVILREGMEELLLIVASARYVSLRCSSCGTAIREHRGTRP
jgi:hypothetical protein